MRNHDQFEASCNRQLTINVDGQPLRGGTTGVYTMQAVLASLNDSQQQWLEEIRRFVGPEVGVIDSLFDDTPLLLNQLGFQTRGVAGEDLAVSNLRLIAISCPHRHARLDEIDTLAFLERGGVILSSDRAIQLPGISSHLGRLPGRPPARARLSVTPDDAPANPPVWLDAGHMPVDQTTRKFASVTRLADNALTGEPLVVLVRAGNGGILHSVAHWLQTPHPELLTSVERRPLRDVPCFHHTGNSYPGIGLGGFLAQRAMVDLLIHGLTAAYSLEAYPDPQQIEREK